MKVDDRGVPGSRSLEGAAPVWLALALAGGVAWIVTIGRARDMGVGPGTMGMALPLFLGMWSAMMAAMMLPAIGPQAAGETLAARTRALRIPNGFAFGAGFLMPWAFYGGLAFAALKGTGQLAESSSGAAKWLGVAIFAVAGLYQLSPWKTKALAHCRMSMHRSDRPNLASSLGAGMTDGAFCVGCCWLLMAVLFAVGVMNLLAMGLLAALIFAEKVLPRPRLIAGAGGVALIALAAAAAVHPSLLSGLTGSGMAMSMGGM